MLARLGANLERERKALGFTQERLAELTDLHPRVVQKIEAGETGMRVPTLIRLQVALGCSWERLMAGVAARGAR